jgi:hypothetical protein
MNHPYKSLFEVYITIPFNAAQNDLHATRTRLSAITTPVFTAKQNSIAKIPILHQHIRATNRE